MSEKLPYSIKTIRTSNKDWEYISEGKGDQTLLIFPGGGQIAQSAFDLIEAFGDRYRIIAVTIFQVETIEEFCKSIDAILEKERVNKVILYGLSLGGMLVQSYLRRNKTRVTDMIISHSVVPKSIFYRRKIIIPLHILNIFLPIIPTFLIKKVIQKGAGGIQGASGKKHKKYMNSMKEKTKVIHNSIAKEFYVKYMNKILLRTWIDLHFDFHYHEIFTPNDLSDWKGRILILRTDNDPLAQDDGGFAKLYREAQVYIFHGTGHLTFYYQSEKIIEVIKKFS